MPLRARASVYARAAIFLAFSVAGCKDGTGSSSGSDDDVASVTVTGAPNGPLLTGGTVQLVATPINATGAAVSGETVAWTSSDTLVAKVGTQGMVTAVGAGPVSITATVEKKQGAVTLDVRAGGVMGPDGGTLSVLSGAATVVLPPSALTASTTVLLRPAISPAANPRMVPGTAFELGPEGMRFNRSSSLTLRYDATRIPAGVAPSALQLYMMSNGAWILVRGSRVNTAERAVTGAITGSGIYAVAGTVAEQVALRGSAAGGALYTGQRAQLSAVVTDINRDTLQGRVAAWTSSDATLATVDSTGMVAALAAGTVTITATVDGKSASTGIIIITRPTASWSQTADWATLQGDAGHRGEIAATLDPIAFREQWTATLAAGVVLNAAATGGGKVFASTQAYFGTQRLWALDGATGAQRWARDFGQIHSVQSPAFGNDRVYLQTGGHEDSFLWSLDAGDGTLRFRTAYGNQWSQWEAPVVADSGVYAGGGYYGGMSRFNAITGVSSYFMQRPQNDAWTPAVAGGLVFSFNETGLTATNSRSGTTAYQINDTRLPRAATPVVSAANRVLGTTPSTVFAIDLENRRVAWVQPQTVAGPLVVSNGLVYIPAMRQVDVRQESDGALLWSWIIPDAASQASMIVTRNILFVSTATTTYAVDLAARRHTWVYPVGGKLSMSKEGLLLIAQPN
ncbi:MAG TPA: Ig-like domain-containing protein, partial [Longimicrobium sp.]